VTTVTARADGERGVALIYALVFTTVVSIIVAALLGQATAQFRAADVYSSRRSAVFAADAGLEHALSTIGLFAAPAGSGSPATCTTAATCPVTPALTAHKEAAGTSPVTVSGFSLPNARGANRLVVVATGTTGATTAVGSVTFNGTAMHRAIAKSGTACWFFFCWGASTELWYLLDAELPATAGSYAVKATASSGAPTYAVHVSSWVGVLQDVGGVAAAPTSAGTGLGYRTSQISTAVTTVANDTLLVSAVAHADDDSYCTSNDSLTGTGAGTRLTNGPHPSCGGFGTSWALRATGSQTATETFAVSSTANSQVVSAFRAASSAPTGAPVFGAGCVGTPIHLPNVNGFDVAVSCALTTPDTLTVVSTATSGTTTVVGRALLTRLADGRVEVSQWDVRPPSR
jgi:Tfp pilus assembly protein PilX